MGIRVRVDSPKPQRLLAGWTGGLAGVGSRRLAPVGESCAALAAGSPEGERAQRTCCWENQGERRRWAVFLGNTHVEVHPAAQASARGSALCVCPQVCVRSHTLTRGGARGVWPSVQVARVRAGVLRLWRRRRVEALSLPISRVAEGGARCSGAPTPHPPRAQALLRGHVTTASWSLVPRAPGSDPEESARSAEEATCERAEAHTCERRWRLTQRPRARGPQGPADG